MSEDRLTPTEELVMEVLAARWRLGESLWTFDSAVARQVQSLADRGLANEIHGTVEKSIRASLTDEGRSRYVTENYMPPLLRRLWELHADLANPDATLITPIERAARRTVGRELLLALEPTP